MLPAAMMRVGRALLAAHFGDEELPAKRTKHEESPEAPKIICEMNKDKARVTVSNDPKAVIMVFFTRANSKDLYYDDCEENIDFDANIAFLYAGGLPSGMIREMLCELFKRAVARGYVQPNSNVYLEASGEVRGSFSLLIQMYQRMSFVPMGILTTQFYWGYDPDKKKYTLEQLKQDLADKKEVDGSLTLALMASKVQDLISWCDAKFPEDRHLLTYKDQEPLSLRVF